MKMYHKYCSLVLLTCVCISSNAGNADNQPPAGIMATWERYIISAISTDIPLVENLKFKSIGYPAFVTMLVYKIYKAYTLPINIEMMENRLFKLESATNGLLAKRHANLEITRSSTYTESIWRLSDQLLELRCELNIPEFKQYDEATQKAMLGKIDSLLKRLELITKIKIAAVAS